MGRPPKRIGEAVGRMREASAPQTMLGSVQAVWAQCVGEQIAGVSEPTAERQGQITVSCESAVWAQELDLMSDQILVRLRERMDRGPESLRFRSHPGR